MIPFFFHLLQYYASYMAENWYVIDKFYKVSCLEKNSLWVFEQI